MKTKPLSLVTGANGHLGNNLVRHAFKLRARDEEKEIYQVNLEGTRNSIEAAAAKGIKKIVYVIPVQYLASYLGIRPESLSRIRRRLVL